MSELGIKSISASTGQFAVLNPAPERSVQSGKTRSESGNNVPELEHSDIAGLAHKLNIASRSLGRDLRFQVDLNNGTSVIQVLDRETGEIIRQIPPENAKAYLSDQGSVALRLYDGLV